MIQTRTLIADHRPPANGEYRFYWNSGACQNQISIGRAEAEKVVAELTEALKEPA